MAHKKEVKIERGRYLARRYAERAGHTLPKLTRKLTCDPSREIYSAVCTGCGIEVKVEHYETIMGSRTERGWRIDESVFQKCVKRGV